MTFSVVHATIIFSAFNYLSEIYIQISCSDLIGFVRSNLFGFSLFWINSYSLSFLKKFLERNYSLKIIK